MKIPILFLFEVIVIEAAGLVLKSKFVKVICYEVAIRLLLLPSQGKRGLAVNGLSILSQDGVVFLRP